MSSPHFVVWEDMMLICFLTGWMYVVKYLCCFSITASWTSVKLAMDDKYQVKLCLLLALQLVLLPLILQKEKKTTTLCFGGEGDILFLNPLWFNINVTYL